jgi:hypothetical protein
LGVNGPRPIKLLVARVYGSGALFSLAASCSLITNLGAYPVDLAHKFVPRHRRTNWPRVGGSKDFIYETSIFLTEFPMLDTTLA